MEKLVLTATPLEGYNSFRVSHFWECACGEANTHLPTEESCEDCGTLRENGKPTQLAIEKGCALRVPNGFGHDDFWHRKQLPAVLREAMLLD